MKYLLSLILLVNGNCFGQPLIGTGIGLSSDKKAVYNIQFGYVINKSTFLYFQDVPVTSKRNSPIVLGLKYGYEVFDFQPNIGLAYHVLSTEIKKENHYYHISYGLSKYFNSFKFDITYSGGYATLCFVIFKLIE